MVTAAPVPGDVVTTPGQRGGVPVVHVDIPGTTTEGVILYFHGGFFAIGSAEASVGLASDLARQARSRCHLEGLTSSARRTRGPDQASSTRNVATCCAGSPG